MIISGRSIPGSTANGHTSAQNSGTSRGSIGKFLRLIQPQTDDYSATPAMSSQPDSFAIRAQRSGSVLVPVATSPLSHQDHQALGFQAGGMFGLRANSDINRTVADIGHAPTFQTIDVAAEWTSESRLDPDKSTTPSIDLATDGFELADAPASTTEAKVITLADPTAAHEPRSQPLAEPLSFTPEQDPDMADQGFRTSTSRTIKSQPPYDRGRFRVDIGNSDHGVHVGVIASELSPEHQLQIRRRVLELIATHSLRLAGLSINGAPQITGIGKHDGR